MTTEEKVAALRKYLFTKDPAEKKKWLAIFTEQPEQNEMPEFMKSIFQ